MVVLRHLLLYNPSSRAKERGFFLLWCNNTGRTDGPLARPTKNREFGTQSFFTGLPQENGGARKRNEWRQENPWREYALFYPTTTPPIWAARKWRKTSAGTQNLPHNDKFGGAGVAQARADQRRARGRTVSLIHFLYWQAQLRRLGYTKFEFEFKY